MRSLYGDATSTAVTCGHLLPFVLSWSDDLSGGLVTFDFLSKQSVLLDNIGKGSGRSAVASEAVTRDVLVVKKGDATPPPSQVVKIANKVGGQRIHVHVHVQSDYT